MKKLLHYFAHKYKAYGYDYEDILQEMELARVIAERTWKPGEGANFKTYLTNVARNHFIKLHRHDTKLLCNPLAPPPETSYRQEPSFTMREARELFEGVKHEKTRAILLHALDLAEAGLDFEILAVDGPVVKASGVSKARVHQLLTDVRKTPAFRKFREELYA